MECYVCDAFANAACYYCKRGACNRHGAGSSSFGWVCRDPDDFCRTIRRSVATFGGTDITPNTEVGNNSQCPDCGGPLVTGEGRTVCPVCQAGVPMSHRTAAQNPS